MLVAAVIVVSRDQQIERLTWEVNQLRRELARVKAEDQMVIESLHNRVHELEMELDDLRQIAESTTTVSQSVTLPPPVWVRECRIDPLRFLAGWRKRRLNQAFCFVLA